MKKIALHTLILSIIFFVVAWLLVPLVMEKMNLHFTALIHKSKIVSLSLTDQFNILFYTAFTFAAIPFLVFFVLLLVKAINKKINSLSVFYVCSAILTTMYLLAALLKIKLLEVALPEFDNYTIDPSITNAIPIAQFYFYSWGFYGVMIGAILTFLVLLKRNS